MILAETILMATGLLERPTITHVRAARGLQAELRADLLATLDRDDPGRLHVCPERVTYFDRLSNPPDYEGMEEALAPLVGDEVADQYAALHQNARQTLLGLRPATTIDTVLGPQVLPLDVISEGRWLVEVDIVEGMRLLKDLAAGALLREEVDVFSAVFPEIYAYLLTELDLDLAKRVGASRSWAPAPWLGDALRVFEKKPFGATLELKPPTPPEQPARPRSTGGKLDTEGLKTRAQTT